MFTFIYTLNIEIRDLVNFLALIFFLVAMLYFCIVTISSTRCWNKKQSIIFTKVAKKVHYNSFYLKRCFSKKNKSHQILGQHLSPRTLKNRQTGHTGTHNNCSFLQEQYCLHLSSCSLKFESEAHLLCFFNLLSNFMLGLFVRALEKGQKWTK